MGHNPSKHVVLASYSANLSKERSVEARHRTLEPIYHRIFPGMRSRGIKASSEFWGTNKWGSFKAVGVGGSLTGRGADLLIVDDPFSNYEEAHSQTIRDNVWNWFLSVAMTRLSPDATVIIIMTRWHVDDMVGRLMDPSFQKLLGDGPDSEKFERINLPALADTDDPLGREQGESAYPEKFTAERYKAIQSLLGSYLFSALYQGNPVRKGGNYCNVDDFVICDREEVPADLRWSRFWDLATSEDTMADFTASPAGAMGPPPGWKPKPLPSGGFEEMPKTHFYIRDMIRGQWEWPKSRERIRATAELERIEVGIEAVAGFKTAFQNVREVLPGHIPLREIGVSKDKLTRALGWMAMVEAKKVILVRGDWINEFKSEVEAFPAGKHDDMVDGVSGVYGMVAQPILFGLL